MNDIIHSQFPEHSKEHVTKLLLQVHAKVQATHERILNQERQDLIAEEEAILQKRVLEMSTTSDEDIFDVNLSRFRELLYAPDNPYEPTSVQSDMLNETIVQTIASVKNMSDVYLEKKRVNAIAEVDNVLAELCKNVDIDGESSWKQAMGAASSRNKTISERTKLNHVPSTDQESLMKTFINDQKLIAQEVVDGEYELLMKSLVRDNNKDLSDLCDKLREMTDEYFNELVSLCHDQAHENHQTSSASSRAAIHKAQEMKEIIHHQIDTVTARYKEKSHELVNI